ncbi:MAG: hypothetical protein K8W52_42025 [Deltaproteobacteria bacterium]|nr:hypothetical protein [Deltaproteobacteria bacterium]
MIRGAAIGALIAALASTAHADTSYRWQLMLSDGISDAAAGTLLSERLVDATHGGLFYAGAAGVLLGAPIIHAAHGDWRAAGVSLGARAALPVGIGYFAAKVCDDKPRKSEWFPCVGALLVVAAVGVVGAEVIDWTLLDHTDASAAPLIFHIGGGF